MSPLRKQLQAVLGDAFVIEKELTRGGMSHVFVAEEVALGRRIVIKVLDPDLAASVSVDRFKREVALTARLQDPHIVPIFSTGEVDGLPYYTMPFVVGDSLRTRLDRDGPLPLADALGILRDVALALECAHDQNVVHRDIKPDNVLLANRSAIVTDFGVAKAFSLSANETTTTLTTFGMTLGTPAYMAPEQGAADPNIDHRADIYSYGVLAYEMLTGMTPFGGRAPMAMIAAHITEEPTPIGSLRNGLPAALCDLIMLCLRKEPEARPQTAAEVLSMLDAMGTVREDAGSAVEMAPVAANTRTVAVLAFRNLSGSPENEYLSDGITEEILNALARVPALRVAARTSSFAFKGQDVDIKEIARKLRVGSLLEGSVRKAGVRLRVSAQLSNAIDGFQMWSERYDREIADVFEIQDEIASRIAASLQVALFDASGEQVATPRRRSMDMVAYELYLRGRYFFNRPSDENLQKAIVQFEEAVRLSPNFASAWSGLSDAYLWAGYNEGFITASAAKPKAREAAEKAVQLDSMSVEAQTTLAIFKLFYKYDWVGMERTFRKAIALNPNYAYAHDQFGMGLAFIGRIDESIAEGRRAAELDPLSPQVLVDASIAYIFRKDFAGAKALAKRAGELDPSYFFPVMIEGWADMAAGRFKEAIEPLERAKTLGAPPFLTAYLAYAYGASGDRAGTQRQLAELRAMSPDGSVLPFNMALVYLGLGDHARAIEHLEKARAADSQMLGWLGQDPIFDRLRGEPRFQALLKQLNF